MEKEITLNPSIFDVDAQKNHDATALGIIEDNQCISDEEGDKIVKPLLSFFDSQFIFPAFQSRIHCHRRWRWPKSAEILAQSGHLDQKARIIVHRQHSID